MMWGVATPHRWLMLYSRWYIINSNTIFAIPDSLSSTFIRYTRVPSHFQLLAGSSWWSSSPMMDFVLLKFQGDETLGEGNLFEAFLYAVMVLGVDVLCNFWRSHSVWILAAGLLNSARDNHSTSCCLVSSRWEKYFCFGCGVITLRELFLFWLWKQSLTNSLRSLIAAWCHYSDSTICLRVELWERISRTTSTTLPNWLRLVPKLPN